MRWLRTYKFVNIHFGAIIILLISSSLFAQSEVKDVKNEVITGNNDVINKEIVNKQDVRKSEETIITDQSEMYKNDTYHKNAGLYESNAAFLDALTDLDLITHKELDEAKQNLSYEELQFYYESHKGKYLDDETQKSYRDGKTEFDKSKIKQKYGYGEKEEYSYKIEVLDEKKIEETK